MKVFEKYRQWWHEHPLQWWLIIVIAVATPVGFRLLSLAEGIQILLMLTLVLVTYSYARETRRISRSSEEIAKAALKQSELSAKIYDPDLIVYSKDRYRAMANIHCPAKRANTYKV